MLSEEKLSVTVQNHEEAVKSLNFKGKKMVSVMDGSKPIYVFIDATVEQLTQSITFHNQPEGTYEEASNKNLVGDLRCR